MKKWLHNPFELIVGWTSLFLGSGIVFVTAIITYFSHTRLDGVIDLHLADHVSFPGCLLEGLIDWLSLGLFIYLSGLLLSKSSVRIIDVIGTQGMARFPFLLAGIFSFLFFNNNVLHYIEFKFLKIGRPVEITMMDVTLFAIGISTTVLMLVWMIILMYRSYSVSCNIKGSKGIISFILCLVFAEILAKFLINIFYPVGI